MYGGVPYAGGPYAGSLMAETDIPVQTDTTLSVEVAFTTGTLEEPVWVDVTEDVRAWDTTRGRGRELERMQPGRATIILANRERQYDSHHATGPYYGNLRPMRRVRIRETFNGVTYPIFDGFVDGWHLDYPGMGLDATATIIATDGFKVFGRTELPLSVYHDEVDTDSPLLWYRLDEQLEVATGQNTALNWGTAGTAGDGTYVGAFDSGDRLVVNDPGGSLEQSNDIVTPGVPVTGVDFPSSQINMLEKFNTPDAFSIEFWCRPQEETTFGTAFLQQATTPAASQFYVIWYTEVGSTGEFSFVAGAESVTTPNNSAPPGSIYHVVVTFTPSGANQLVSVYLNGALSASGTLTGTLNTGTINGSSIGKFLTTESFNWTGRISQFAIYTTTLSATRVAAHYAAGTHPWQDDQPAGRAARVLDMVDWPAGWRNLDAGNVALQSAELGGQTALEHLQKVGETEFGLLFMGRDGNVRLAGREWVFGRDPDPAVFGDGAGEVGYRAVTFEDGDTTVRNRATISRLNGVAKTSVDAGSVTEFGRFDYVLDGLLHRLDSYSLDYANLVTGEYHEPRRRVTGLTLGPPAADADATLLPQMLGREIGDAVVVKDTPLGGGDRFEQTCVIEGITHQWDPHSGRTASWVLSPEFAVRELEDEAVATLGYAQVVASQGSITGTAVDLTGLSSTVTVGASRRVRISAQIPVQSTVHDDNVRLDLLEGAAFQNLGQLQITTSQNILKCDAVITPSAGAHTYKLQLSRTTGTGTITMAASAAAPAFILVEDIGPV